MLSRTTSQSFWGALFVLTLGCAPNPNGPLDPPAQGAGFQLKTQPLTVPPGTENQDCYFFRVPAQADAYVNRIVMRQTAGSHHMNIFRVKTIVGLSGDDGTIVHGSNDLTNPCWKSSNWADWPLVVNTQASDPSVPDTVLQLPDGVAHKFAPGELLMLQSHFVNASTQQTSGQAAVWVNFEYIDKSQVTAELGTLFATDQCIQICPGQSKFFEQTCRIPSPVTIFAANGHFHSRGTRFQMNLWDQQNGKGAMFYDNTSWNEPTMATGLSAQVPQNGGIVYHCEYKVPDTACGAPKANACVQQPGSCCYTFGPSVENNEHCNAFVYYYPKLTTDITCN